MISFTCARFFFCFFCSLFLFGNRISEELSETFKLLKTVCFRLYFLTGVFCSNNAGAIYNGITIWFILSFLSYKGPEVFLKAVQAKHMDHKSKLNSEHWFGS